LDLRLDLGFRLLGWGRCVAAGFWDVVLFVDGALGGFLGGGF
jgi:hypothetical protein